MSKEVLLIYQDCPYCAPREEWGKEQTRVARENGIKVTPVHFNTLGAKGLIAQAVSRGVEAMPFFTDGERFSYKLIDFVENKATTSNSKRSRSKVAQTVEAEGKDEVAVQET